MDSASVDWADIAVKLAGAMIIAFTLYSNTKKTSITKTQALQLEVDRLSDEVKEIKCLEAKCQEEKMALFRENLTLYRQLDRGRRKYDDDTPREGIS